MRSPRTSPTIEIDDPSHLWPRVWLGALMVTVLAGVITFAVRAAERSNVVPIKLVTPKHLPVVARTLGPDDPHEFDLSQLIPRRTRLRQVWYLHGGQRPDQVLVEWVKAQRISLYGDFPDDVQWGLTLWTRSSGPPNFQTQWRDVAVPLTKVAPGPATLRVSLADVTGDHHPDVLVEQYLHTNHGCGPHEVVATLGGGGTWRVFGPNEMCETTLRGTHGMLALDLPVYSRSDSVCCWSHVRQLRLQWTGRRYVVASNRVVPARRR